LITLLLIRWWKKQKEFQEGVKRKLRQRERELKEDGERIKIKVKEIK